MDAKKLSVVLIGLFVLGGFVATGAAQDGNVNFEAVIGGFDSTPNSPAPNAVYQENMVPNGNGGYKKVYQAVPVDESNGAGGKSGFGNWGSSSQYEPKKLVDKVYKSEWMPEILPGWGPYGDVYPIEGDPKWTSRRYFISPGDVIIAVNDRRVRSMKDFNLAMNCAGRYVVLTVADHRGKTKDDVYCICAKVINHRLPINVGDSYYVDDLAEGLAELTIALMEKNSKNKSAKKNPKKQQEKVQGAYVQRCFDDFEGYIYRPTCPFPLYD